MKWPDDAPITCPLCSADLRDGPIPAESQHLYGGRGYFLRLVGVAVPGVYDGALFWRCPDCGGQWHRWSEGTRQHAAAERYLRMIEEAS